MKPETSFTSWLLSLPTPPVDHIEWAHPGNWSKPILPTDPPTDLIEGWDD